MNVNVIKLSIRRLFIYLRTEQFRPEKPNFWQFLTLSIREKSAHFEHLQHECVSQIDRAIQQPTLMTREEAEEAEEW